MSLRDPGISAWKEYLLVSKRPRTSRYDDEKSSML